MKLCHTEFKVSIFNLKEILNAEEKFFSDKWCRCIVPIPLVAQEGRATGVLVGAGWWKQEQKKIEILGIELPCNSLSLL